jgi:hypothetical protein
MERLRRLAEQGDETAAERLRVLELRRGRGGRPANEITLGYGVLRVFSQWWYGQGDPLYAVLSRRGNSVDLVTLEASREERHLLEDLRNPRRRRAFVKETMVHRMVLAITRREMDRLQRLSDQGDEVAAEILERWTDRKNWYGIARLELMAQEGVEIGTRKPTRQYDVESVRMEAKGRGRSGETNWVVFKSQRDATKHTTGYLQEKLQKEPYEFDFDWLAGFMSADQATRAMLTERDTEIFMADMDDDDIMHEAGMGDEWEHYLDEQVEPEEDFPELQERIQGRLEEAHDIARQRIMQEIQGELDKLPEYLMNKNHDWKKGLPDWVKFNIEGAARNLIEQHGLAHNLGHHGQTQLDSGAVAFATE